MKYFDIWVGFDRSARQQSWLVILCTCHRLGTCMQTYHRSGDVQQLVRVIVLSVWIWCRAGLLAVTARRIGIAPWSIHITCLKECIHYSTYRLLSTLMCEAQLLKTDCLKLQFLPVIYAGYIKKTTGVHFCLYILDCQMAGANLGTEILD